MVTVVVPLHDGKRFIGQTLRSVLAQTFERFEVIVVDDGSSDDGPEVVRSLAADPRVRLVTVPHRGVAAARNEGAARASDATALLAFLDADDIWGADVLTTLVGALEARPDAAGAFVLAEYIDASGDVLHSGDFPRHMRSRQDLRNGELVPRDVRADIGPEHLVFSNPVYPPSCLLLRRSAFDAVGGFDGRFLAEDWEFALRLAGNGPIVPVDRVLVGYRRHTANVSRDRARNVLGARQVWASAFHAPHASPETREHIRAVWRAHQSRTAARKVAEARGMLVHGRLLTGIGRLVDGLVHAMLRQPPRFWARGAHLRY